MYPLNNLKCSEQSDTREMVGISDANDEEKDQKVVEAASLPLSRMRVRRNPEKKVVEESSDSDSGKDCSASDEEDEGYKPKGRPNAKKPVILKKTAPAASIKKKVVRESSDSDSGKNCSASDEEDEGYKPKGRPNAKKPVTLKKAAPVASIKKKAKVNRNSDVDSEDRKSVV